MLKVTLALVLLVALVAASDIASFGRCIKQCRRNKESFSFCLSFCKPSKNATVAESAAETESDADNTVPDSTELWSKYRQALLEFLRQGNANLFPGLQLVPQPFAADWDQDERILANLANRLPKPGQAYEQSVYELTTEFGDFITNIIIPDDKPVDRQKFAAARRRIRQVEDRINDAEMDCAERYDSRVARRSAALGAPLPFETYAFRFCKEMEEAKRELTSVLYDFEILKRSQYGEHFRLKDTVVKFMENNDKKFIAYGSLSRFVDAAKENRGNSFEVKINQFTKTSNEKTSSMSINAGFSKEGVISIGANFEKTSMKLTTSNREFQLVVGAASYKYIPVFPDRTWFSPEVISKYARYPMRNRKDYFSTKGTMPLIPKGFIVVAGPKVTMLLNAEDTSRIEKSSKMGLNVNVGGFNFDFKKDAGMKKSSESGNLFRIQIEGNSYEPLVMAVDNQVNELLIR